MTVEIFLILLTVFATVTSLVTEAVKKVLDSAKVTYASNILVLCSSAVVGGCGTTAFYLLNGYSFGSFEIVCILLMVCANWLGSMIGYDKVKQAITQIIAQFKRH